jgi:hypothetical protein
VRVGLGGGFGVGEEELASGEGLESGEAHVAPVARTGSTFWRILSASALDLTLAASISDIVSV